MLEALQETHYQACDSPSCELLAGQIAREVDHVAQLIAAERDCAALSELAWLEQLTHTRVRPARNRVLLTFLYDPDSRLLSIP